MCRTPGIKQYTISKVKLVWFSFFAFRFRFRFRFSFFDIRIESENPILIFKILFWHSNWVGKSYFDIQNPILTFAMSRKILFWQSLWVRKSYFDIQNPNLTYRIDSVPLSSNVKKRFWISKHDIPTQFECQKRILNVKIGFSDSWRMSKYGFEYQNRIFWLIVNVKIGFWIWN